MLANSSEVSVLVSLLCILSPFSITLLISDMSHVYVLMWYADIKLK